MLPKNKLRERRLARLRIFEGPDAGVFAHNILQGHESPAPIAAPPQIEPRPKKPREVEPELLDAWKEVAAKHNWTAPPELAKAKTVEA
jgi:hypothetical protein